MCSPCESLDNASSGFIIRQFCWTTEPATITRPPVIAITHPHPPAASPRRAIFALYALNFASTHLRARCSLLVEIRMDQPSVR